MAKSTGIGWSTLTVDDVTGTPQSGVKTDTTDIDFTTPREVDDITSIDASAHERLLLLADFSITVKGAFNPTTGQAHDVFQSVCTSGVARTTSITVNGVSLPNEVLYTDYTVTRDAKGSLNWEAKGMLADGTVPTWA